ncbi:exodeoxyribonuclease VII small subunit [Pelistega indica]|uniref:Exodeoxyribonuclease 7 small subunit n=2 Tax=Pelistega TaxID=106146 RepID=V8G0G8_9BURK|nr:exodeoxyribonuclease VII small subunit [Pelistega indica]
MSKANKAPTNFEDALAELEQIVEGMENNTLTLEESLKAYERGVFLARVCQEKLDAANQQVLVLQKNLLQPLNNDGEDEEDIKQVNSTVNVDDSDEDGIDDVDTPPLFAPQKPKKSKVSAPVGGDLGNLDDDIPF